MASKKKNGNGEGSIYKRRDGRWTATISLERGRRKSFYGTTRAAVAEKMAAALSRYHAGAPVPREVDTVASFLERWLDHSAARVRPTTMLGYRRMVRLHIAPAIGGVKLTQLRADALQRFYAQLQRGGLSTKYVRLIHALMHAALKQALRWELVINNVADLVDPPALTRKEFRALSAEEARAFLAAARESDHYALYVLALTTGMREGELLGLRWRDVNLEDRWLSVVQQAQRIGGEWTFTAPKTKSGRRRLALPAVAVTALREQRARVATLLLRAPAWEDHDLVFPNQVGRPIEKQNLMRRSFKPLLAKAGLPDIRFHDLRHSAATIMLGMGEHPRVVQERLGHATVAVTLDIYSHVTQTLQEEAAERLDRVFAAG